MKEKKHEKKQKRRSTTIMASNTPMPLSPSVNILLGDATTAAEASLIVLWESMLVVYVNAMIDESSSWQQKVNVPLRTPVRRADTQGNVGDGSRRFYASDIHIRTCR
jgi:hypothetical protein